MKTLEGQTIELFFDEMLSSYQYSVQGQQTLRLYAPKQSKGAIYIELIGSEASLLIEGVVEEGSDVQLVLQMSCTEKLAIKQSLNIKKDAHIAIGYADFSDGELAFDAKVVLQEKGAEVSFLSVSNVSTKKEMQMECIHEVPYTMSEVQNFSLVNEHGNLKQTVIGRIVKGANDSSCHQSSRVLTTSKKQTSDVLPILYIDENEVKASHATSVGQPDADQLYYLQSRGLTHTQALGLLTIGYLLPITEVIADETLKEYLKEQIEKKVGIHV